MPDLCDDTDRERDRHIALGFTAAHDSRVTEAGWNERMQLYYDRIKAMLKSDTNEHVFHYTMICLLSLAAARDEANC